MAGTAHTERSSPVTDRAAAVEYTSIRVMYEQAEQRGGDLVRMEVGQPDFRPPEHVTEAAVDAARGGETTYTQTAGLPDLRRALADRLAADHNVEYDPETEVVMTVGGMEALLLATLTVVAPGEEVVIPTPAWPNYETQVRLADGVPIEVPLPADDGFDLDLDRIDDAMGQNTAAVILASPSNPTGRAYGEAELAGLVDLAAEHDAVVIADEVYKRLTFEGSTRALASYTDHPERVLSVGSCSKTYAMTGWRVGWLAGPEPVIDKATKVHGCTTACVSNVAQRAAEAALSGPQAPVDEMYDAFERRRDLVVERVEDLPTVTCPRPEGAFYAFLDCNALDGTSLDVAKRLLAEEGVVLAPGGGFGDAGEGYLRMSFAASEERIDEGFDRIEAFVREEVR